MVGIVLANAEDAIDREKLIRILHRNGNRRGCGKDETHGGPLEGNPDGNIVLTDTQAADKLKCFEYGFNPPPCQKLSGGCCTIKSGALKWPVA